MGLQEIFNIISLVVIVNSIFIIVGIFIMYKRKRSGKMSMKTKIEYASGEVIHELRSKYTDWGLGSLESLKSIDKYIDEKKKLYKDSELLEDNDLIFRLAAFTGELIRMKKGYKWVFLTEEPYMIKKNSIIFPFDKIRKNVINGEEDSIYIFSKFI